MKKGNRIEYYDLDGDKNVCQILSRAGKAGGGYQHCYNIRDQHGNIKWVDLSRTVEKWRQLPEEEAVLLCDGSSDDIFAAKLAEMENWKNGVLRKLKHIFPNTYQRIKSICSPAKGGTCCYRFNYQPGS